jgi:hypothetical protein
MKTLLGCLAFSLGISLFAYICLTNNANNAKVVEYANPFGVALGFFTTLQGIVHSKKYVSLLGLSQLSFWPLYGFFLAVFAPPNILLQIFLTTLVTIYLGASLVLFGMAFYDLRWGKKTEEAGKS